MIAPNNTSIALSNVSVNISSEQRGVDHIYLFDVSHLFNLVDLNAGTNPGWTVHKETSFTNRKDLIILVHSDDVEVKIDGTREAVRATAYGYTIANGCLNLRIRVGDQCYYTTIDTASVDVDGEDGEFIPTISYNV